MSPSKELIEIQLELFRERMVEITIRYGIDSEEAKRFNARYSELLVRYQKLHA